MKTSKIMAAALAVVLAASCSSNGSSNAAVNGADSTAVKTVDPKTLKPTKSQIDSVSYLIGINFGSFIKGYNFSKDGKDINYNLIKKGIVDYLKAQGDYRDSAYAKQFKINPESMNDAFNSFLMKRREYAKAVNKQKEVKFLADNQKKDSVQVTASGLQYIIRAAGNDVKPGPEDTVYVHYKGTLTDGTTFDESPKNEEGVRMLLNRVIKGWTEGLQLIGEGGKITLFVPSELGYGENGTQGIEPNSTLIFDVDIVKVNKVAPAADAEEETK